MPETQTFTGGCYCRALKYAISGKPIFKAQCHCRECQYFSGGGPNYFMLLPPDDLNWTTGAPATFTRPDLDNAVTRSFCQNCGTHILTELPHGQYVVLKIGTLDDPATYEAPTAAIHAADKQPFHLFPDGAPVFDRLPPR